MYTTRRLITFKGTLWRPLNHGQRACPSMQTCFAATTAVNLPWQQPFIFSFQMDSRRFYTPPSLIPPMTKDEEEKEKSRVESLSSIQKEHELRLLDKELSLLYMKRGILTGDHYTMKGKLKALARDYGIAFTVWYGVIWVTSVTLIFAGVEYGGVDVMGLIAVVDETLGTQLHQHVDPTIGTVGLVLVVNELVEPLRLPFVFMTTKPVVHFLFPASDKEPSARIIASSKIPKDR